MLSTKQKLLTIVIFLIIISIWPNTLSATKNPVSNNSISISSPQSVEKDLNPSEVHKLVIMIVVFIVFCGLLAVVNYLENNSYQNYIKRKEKIQQHKDEDEDYNKWLIDDTIAKTNYDKELSNMKLQSRNEDFMMKEFDRYSDLFKENENLGERRVNFYLTLITSVIAALGITTFFSNLTSNTEIQTSSLLIFASFILFGLFMYGFVTLRRIIHRNVVTDDYKVKLDIIRKQFGIELNEPVPSRRKRVIKEGLWIGNGGIVETIRFLNSLIIGVVCSIIWLYPASQLEQTVSLEVIIPFIIAFLGTWVGQTYFTNIYYIKEEKKKLRLIKKK